MRKSNFAAALVIVVGVVCACQEQPQMHEGLLCYQVESPDALDDRPSRIVRSQFDEQAQRTITLASLQYLCEPVYKDVGEPPRLPEQPPDKNPLTCYTIASSGGGEPPAIRVTTDNGLLDTELEVLSPFLFCDPVAEKVVDGQPSNRQPYPTPLMVYRVSPRQSKKGTVHTIDQLETQTLELGTSQYLFDPSSKSEGDEDPGTPDENSRPLLCFQVESAASTGKKAIVTDQFVTRKTISLASVHWFCDYTEKVHLPND